MTEEFIYFVWQNKLFDLENLKTSNNQKIIVQSTGFRNSDEGPDFVNCKILIDDIQWVGAVEVHINSSDWNKHNHHTNVFYNSVVLQIVVNNDVEVFNQARQSVPTAVLHYDKLYYERFMNIIQSKNDIHCGNFLKEVDRIYLKSWFNRLVIERFEKKSQEFLRIYNETLKSFEETFYRLLCKNFGQKVNSLPFELLAESLPYKYIAKQKDNLLQIEAMMFGQAGMLGNLDIEEEYISLLKREYTFLKQKYQLKPIDANLWKYMRMRPQAFPTIRLSILSAFFYKNQNPFEKFIEIESTKQIREMFDVSVSDYWNTHFRFGKYTKSTIKRLGNETIDNIIVNTVCVSIFCYGIIKNNDNFKEKSIELLSSLKSEKNSIIRQFGAFGVEAKNALESQAMIELRNEYCLKNRCLKCSIGGKIIIRKKM